MDETSLEKSITAKYLTQVLKQQKLLPPDISRYLVDQQAALNGSKATGLSRDRCPRCFTASQLSALTTSYSLSPCLRSKRRVRRLRNKCSSVQHKLNARQREMLASHEKFENVLLRRCLICSHQQRTPCVLPDCQRLERRRKTSEDAHKAYLQNDADLQLPKIVVPEILPAKPIRKTHLKEVDCGLTISPSLKLELEQYAQESPLSSGMENTPNTGKKKRKKNKKRQKSDFEEDETSKNIASPVATPKQRVNISGAGYNINKNRDGTDISKVNKQLPMQKGNNLMTPFKAQANTKNNKPLSTSAASALKNALKKSSGPKQSSLKSFLDTLF